MGKNKLRIPSNKKQGNWFMSKLFGGYFLLVNIIMRLLNLEDMVKYWRTP